MVLTLGRAAPYLELRFRILSTPQAIAWSELLADSIAKRGLKEREKFVNFDPDAQRERTRLINTVREVAGRLSVLHPDIEFGEVDFTDWQAEVNRLHVNFADRHLVYRDLTDESVLLWEVFNSSLHQLESVSRRTFIEAASGIRNATADVIFHDSGRLKLTAEDFKEGVLQRNFGVCYLAYSQVGRHIAELFYARDENIPLAHILPFNTMTANFRIWFGHTQSQTAGRELYARIKKWFCEDWKEKFEAANLNWDCCALGIPEIPVACLEEPIFSENRIIELQNKIYDYQYVSEVRLLPG